MARTERFKGARTAQERARSVRQRAATQERERNGIRAQQNAAQGERNGMQRQPITAQNERQRMRGLQGNASGMNHQLSNEQRDRIRNTVINAPGAPRAENVNFGVTVGTVIPRGSIHVVPVPATLVEIEPRWRGFLYFVWMDDVVIVNPRDMRIVAVVPA